MPSLTGLFPYITGAGGALVVLVVAVTLLLAGRVMPRSTHDEIVALKDKQIADLAAARDRERDRADAAVLAAQATKDVLLALHKEAGG